MKTRKLASVPEYTRIPQEVLDKGWSKAVHVEGWPASFRFFHSRTNGVTHHLTTQAGANYVTTRPLLYTKRYEPKQKTKQ